MESAEAEPSQPPKRRGALDGLASALASPFTLPPSIWRDDDGEAAPKPKAGKPVPWTPSDVDAEGLAPGVPRLGELPTQLIRPRKRNLVVIGQYLREYGRWRGVVAIALLLASIHLPVLGAPPDAHVSSDSPPFFLQPVADVHGTVIHLAAAAGLIGVLVLPMLARGMLMLVLGLAPVLLYFAVALVANPVLPAPLANLLDHVVSILPIWIFLSGGLVALQSFPDHRVIRGIVVGASSLMLAVQFFLWGNLWTHAICAVTGGSIVLLAAAALVVATRGNQWLTAGLVKIGWLYVVALPGLYYLWLHELPEMQHLGPATSFLALHGMLFAIAIFLVATLGLADVFHFFSWRHEIRSTLGAPALDLDPASTRFAEQFLAFAAASGRFTPDELAFLQRSMAGESRYPPAGSSPPEGDRR